MRELSTFFARRLSPRCLPLVAATVLAAIPVPAHADWDCSVWWSAYTGDRVMQNTKEECICAPPFHSCGNSWVDIAGGVSQVCNDHSQTFKGWTGDQSSEWDICDPWMRQESQSEQQVASVNQSWDRFPFLWGCPLPDTVYMNSPFFTVYDLDYCSNKQLLGSIYFANFPLQVSLVHGDCGDPYSTVRYRLEGSDQRRCCGGTPVSQSEQESYYDWACRPDSTYCQRNQDPNDCWCSCDFPCSTCEPGQPCVCAGCECTCSEWSCNGFDMNDYGEGRCERTKTGTKWPSCEGGNTNGLLCSSLKVVGDYTCVWNWGE
ncbi:MAG TPA: hypothetical protein VF121_13995 [Thermoanaerobaculia bacterium]|nr:hypothetical protein [Thermoanaerobaculia bacterium]